MLGNMQDRCNKVINKIQRSLCSVMERDRYINKIIRVSGYYEINMFKNMERESAKKEVVKTMSRELKKW